MYIYYKWHGKLWFISSYYIQKWADKILNFEKDNGMEDNFVTVRKYVQGQNQEKQNIVVLTGQFKVRALKCLELKEYSKLANF